jgi:hypothetical protein
MINRSPTSKPYPLDIVGSSTFGRYPKISLSKTYNMFESDGWLVPYAGYEALVNSTGEQLNLGTNGRAIFTSTVYNIMIVVVSSRVYTITPIYDVATNSYVFNAVQVGTLTTFSSDVYIAENNGGQIALSDGANIYIYNPSASPSFQTVVFPPNTGFIPGFITFHDTFFICAALGTPSWRLSDSDNGLLWPDDAQHVGELQTKGDYVQAVTRLPSGGNQIFVFGSVVAEPWFNVGYQLFPYQRNTGFNIDYGCLNPSTIAVMDELIVWLAGNEKSGPIIMYTDGGKPEKITTDGIDYLMSQFQNPADSEAFLYRQDGHLFYHINFYTDNISLFYDFNTKKFYHASDENMNYFIAKEVAFFNNQYYFVSKNDGLVYAFDTIYTRYNGEEIPRIRVCSPIRFNAQEVGVVTDAGFTIEMGTSQSYREVDGTPPIQPRVDFSFSIDGQQSFSSYLPYVMNPQAHRINKLLWWQLGWCNEFTAQYRFWGMGRFVATNGEINVKQ